jgi:hypothetical protein
MSETNPTANPTPSTAANPVATTPTIPPGTPGKAPAKVDSVKAQPAAAKPTPEQDRDADLKRLSDLQKEYLDLKEQAGKAQAVPVQADPRAEALARKGEVTREMDAIKRKHGLA